MFRAGEGHRNRATRRGSEARSTLEEIWISSGGAVYGPTPRDTEIGWILVDAGYEVLPTMVFDRGVEATIEHACRRRLEVSESHRRDWDEVLHILTGGTGYE